MIVFHGVLKPKEIANKGFLQFFFFCQIVNEDYRWQIRTRFWVTLNWD